jgi:RimJ/RimL family protein N-acetyltransferase
MDDGTLHTGWPSSIPELATARLRLRGPLPRDAAVLLGVPGDPAVTRYRNVPTLTTLAEAQGLLERLEQRYAARDTIRWAIELVEHGEMIGTVGLLRFDREHRRNYLLCKGRHRSVRWFSLLETEESPGTA